MKRVVGSILLGLAVMLGFPALAQDVVGEVVTVREGAQLQRDGRRFAISPEISILSGDTIVTNRTGAVQLVFRDNTRVVVGPSSQFVATDIQIRRNGRAQKFAINTVGGTFRFLSGDSAKRVYELRTPTATMGIRGTNFDFAIERETNTTLVTFAGEVQMCGAGRRCYAISGSCATVRAGRQGINPEPVEQDAKVRLLQQQFPFTQSQSGLGRSFRTSLVGCGPDDDDDPRFVAPRVVRVATPAPGEVVTPRRTGPQDQGGGSGGSGSSGPRSGP